MPNSGKNLTGSGIPPLAATSINGTCSSAAGLTATGSSQTDAYAISVDNNLFTTTAASTGARLPASPIPGDEVFISNQGANTLTVYPATSDKINALSANAGFSVAAGKSCLFIAIGSSSGANVWTTLLSA